MKPGTICTAATVPDPTQSWSVSSTAIVVGVPEAADWLTLRTEYTLNIDRGQALKQVVPRVYARRRGDADGRVFYDLKLMGKFCLERGYTQEYRDQKLATFKRVHGAWLSQQMLSARDAICDERTQTKADVLRVCDAVVYAIMNRSTDGLKHVYPFPSRWSLGVWEMARALRPDIMGHRPGKKFRMMKILHT